LEDLDFLWFVKKIKQSTAIDLSQYKETQMKRRLTTFRSKKGYDTFLAFYDAMMKDRGLYNEFLDRLTINVSEFWRNPNRWEVLERKFIPELLLNAHRIRCWSAACSTGEEPYTLAMILAEKNALRNADITASDIDEGALSQAREAVYAERSVREVPPHYLAQYFARSASGYTVAAELRRAVKFKKQDLLTEPFDSAAQDLIICRNVTIYFTENAKHMLYGKFAQSLKPGGLLFVGSTEQIFSPERYGLEMVESYFYRKKV
jgi:chemotaxis protein methyltransferase CheR